MVSVKQTVLMGTRPSIIMGLVSVHAALTPVLIHCETKYFENKNDVLGIGYVLAGGGRGSLLDIS